MLLAGAGFRGGPFFKLRQFVYQKDSFTLCACGRFHNPNYVWSPFKFLNDDVVVLRHMKSERHYVKVDKLAVFVFFCDGVVFLFHFLAEPFDVPYHKVFPGQFEVVREVVYESKGN